jgi:hypothetical protein
VKALVVAAMLGALSGAPRVSVAAYPRVAMAPAALKLTAKVAPHEANRLLTVTLDCEHFYDSTAYELEGDKAAKTYQLPLIEGIPPGQCEVTAEVATSEGKTVRSMVVDVEIVGGEPRP